MAILFALALVPPEAQADCQVRLAFKGGLGVADQTYEYSHRSEIDQRTHRETMASGMGLEIGAHRTLSLLLEAAFVRKGSHSDFAWANEGITDFDFPDYEDRVDYLSFLFAARAAVGLGPLSAYCYGGPKIDVKIGINESGWVFLDSIRNSYEPTVPGLTAGLGLDIPVNGRLSCVVEFRYDYDLDIAAEYEYYDFGWSGLEKRVLTIRNQYCSILAGLAVDL